MTMAMPQQDNYIEQIHRLEGLMAYAQGARRLGGAGAAQGAFAQTHREGVA